MRASWPGPRPAIASSSVSRRAIRMYGYRLATIARPPPPPAPADHKEKTGPATRSHPHPSPSQTGSRAASSPPRAGRNFLGGLIVGQAGTEFIGISSKTVLRPRTRPQSPHRHPANFRLKLDPQANLRYRLELSRPIALGSPMIEATSDDAKINGIARIGSQPIALAAAALVIIVIGAGSIALWRAYLGTSPEQDRIAAVRLVQRRAAP